MNLILFGFKGSGKTTLGQLIAQKVGCSFVDTDDLLENEYSLTPRELYNMLGEREFRKREKKVIQSLKELGNTVIAVGGGTVLDPENRELLQKIGKLIYLKASFETICSRLQNQVPSFIDSEDPIRSLRREFVRRTPIYEAIPVECVIGV